MKKKLKPVFAVLLAAALILLYGATLLAALLNIPDWDRLFQACLTAAIGLPILLWICLLICRWRRSQKEDSESESRKEER